MDPIACSRSATPLFSAKSELQCIMVILSQEIKLRLIGIDLCCLCKPNRKFQDLFLKINPKGKSEVSNLQETFSASSEKFETDFPKKNLKKCRRFSDVGPRRGSMSKQLKAIQDAEDNSVFRKIFLNPNDDKFDWDADGSLQSLTLTVRAAFSQIIPPSARQPDFGCTRTESAASA